MHTTLVSVTTLATHIDDPRWLVVDCRFDLANPAAGEAAYEQGHIPNAIYAHLDRDLSGQRNPRTGRHPLPDPEALAATFGSWGLGNQTQVVVYDANVGMYASRLWWLLRWLGHEAVAVLDGGFEGWTDAGLSVSTSRKRRSPQTFRARPQRALWVDADEVASRTSDPAWRILDARAPERFRGEVEPIDPIAGHVPGARNHPFSLNVREGHFAPAEALRTALDRSQDGVADDHTIVMCGSGVTACHVLLAMEIAGKHGARLYPGSWSEWIVDPSRGTAR